VLSVSDAVAQVFRSAVHAYQVQAAGLFRGDRLVAFASPSGRLSMDQVAPAVTASADVASRGSVTRFYTPPGADVDYVLYATPVQGDLGLVALFSMDTPLGNARRTGQALVLAILRSGPATPPTTATLPEAPEPAAESLELPRDWVPEPPSSDLEKRILPGPGPSTSAVTLPRDWVPGSPADESRIPFLRPPEPGPEVGLAPPAAVREIIVHVPVAHGSMPLTFSLVLLPRFPEHRLTGALVPRLRAWVHRLCLAWDWRAESIEIRPDRMAMTLVLEPEVAPAVVVQQLQESLAARILQFFPQLANDLPSGRFWASSFLLVSGPLPVEREIAAFIEETRRAQGFSPRR
jgi:REP element-mobilizing transposase RayT